MFKICHLQNSFHQLFIFRSRELPAVLIRIAPHHHHLKHRKVEDHILTLRHKSYLARQLQRLVLAQWKSINANISLHQQLESRNRPQQGAFAGAIGSHHRTKSGPLEGDRKIPEYLFSLIAGRNIADFYHLTLSFDVTTKKGNTVHRPRPLCFPPATPQVWVYAVLA